MIVLGIDPGTITTGYAFIESNGQKVKVLEYGTLHAPASHALEDRLLHIVSGLEELLDKYKPESFGRSFSGASADLCGRPSKAWQARRA